MEQKEQNKTTNKNDWASEIMSWLKYMVLAIIIGSSISYLIKPTVVSGMSMYPTLHEGDYLLVNRMAYKFDHPKRGDIIVFRSHLSDERYLIKRVIGIEGDKVEIKDGEVFLNDQKIEESYIKNMKTDGNLAVVVPKNAVFVLGDNRENSLDSRSPDVGFVKDDDILGKVLFSIFPPKTIYQ